MTIVDTHTHVISPDTARYPTDPIGGHQSEWSQERPVDAEGVIKALDQAGIAKAVVVQASTVYGHDNRYVVEAVRAHPDRLHRGLFHRCAGPDAVTRIEHWEAQGLLGFRLFTTGTTMPGQSDWLGHERLLPAWEYAEPRHTGLPADDHGRHPDAAHLARAVSGVRVLLDHCARPDLADGALYTPAPPLFDMGEFPGVHLKLTHRTPPQPPRCRRPADFLEKLVTTLRRRTHCLGLELSRPAEGALPELLSRQGRVSMLAAAARRMIFAGTAESLYPMPPAGVPP